MMLPFFVSVPPLPSPSTAYSVGLSECASGTKDALVRQPFYTCLFPSQSCRGFRATKGTRFRAVLGAFLITTKYPFSVNRLVSVCLLPTLKLKRNKTADWGPLWLKLWTWSALMWYSFPTRLADWWNTSKFHEMIPSYWEVVIFFSLFYTKFKSIFKVSPSFSY